MGTYNLIRMHIKNNQVSICSPTSKKTNDVSRGDLGKRLALWTTFVYLFGSLPTGNSDGSEDTANNYTAVT